MVPNSREQRVAYLFFHCGRGPREIVRFCPQEWNIVREICDLRRTILERFLRNAYQLQWRLGKQDSGKADKVMVIQLIMLTRPRPVYQHYKRPSVRI
jgi:hypothetical protein